jgi:hypothetical protein
MEALRGLVDYAGLFPPAQLDLARETDEYRTASTGSYAWMLGRFIVPLAVLAENAADLRDAPLSVIVHRDATGAVSELRNEGAHIELLEVPLSRQFESVDAAIAALRDLRETFEASGIADIRAYVELPRGANWDTLLAGALPELSDLGFRAKLRCGGVTAEAFPSVADVATFVAATSSVGVPFKATAGLHHPIRHRDAATGFMMHGFLNLLAAAALAPSVDRATLHEILAEEDAAAFSLTSSGLRWRNHIADPEVLAATRHGRFVSYGSCSFDEPVEDLIALGMLPR